MDARTAAAQRAAAKMLPDAERWLAQWLTIPSVSGSAEHRPDVERAARLVAVRLQRFADRVAVERSRTGPVVLARVAGRDRTRRAILVYGHFDVRPEGPGWHSPAFSPTREGRRLIARGASDDKGQVLAHLLAAEAWSAVGGPPADVLIVLDSGEEIGSPGLESVLRHPLLTQPVGAIVVSDTRQASPGVPSLTVSLRGTIVFSVTVDAGGPAVHAGRFGGAVCDPSLVLCGALRRANRLVAALPPDPRRVPGSDGPIRQAAARAVVRDHLAERVTTRAALSVTALRSGGTPGAVPGTASARIDVRLPPSLAPGPVKSALVEELSRPQRAQLTVKVRPQGGTRGLVAQHSPATIEAVRDACRVGFGRGPVAVASGGSIPAAVALANAFGCSPILLGFGPVDDGAHGPDEYLDLDDFARAVRTSVALFERLDGERKFKRNSPSVDRSNSARNGLKRLPPSQRWSS